MPGKETRVLLLRIVRDSPGIHTSRLMREANLSWGSVQHHLHVLRREGHIRLRREGRVCRLFSSQVQQGEEEQLAIQHDELTVGLMERLSRDPGKSIRALSLEMGRSRATIRHHLSRMRTAGFPDGAGAAAAQAREVGQIRLALGGDPPAAVPEPMGQMPPLRDLPTLLR